MRLIPNEQDKQPREIIHWVQSADGGPLVKSIAIGSTGSVEDRLEDDFPVYRAIKAAKHILGKLTRANDDEI